jgi:hypothetical protein
MPKVNWLAVSLVTPAIMGGTVGSHADMSVVCIGKFEQNCPAKHDFFYSCKNHSREDVAKIFCPPGKYLIEDIKNQPAPTCAFDVFRVECQK